ncbi:MAG: class I SAM-dependent methyltransferase [Bacteroidia bacterium]|nr:class I SAM-dependent methyltransferase [Bacteroidia bacterium]
MTQVFSPFDPFKPARIIKTVATTEIVQGYKKVYGLDVARLFHSIPEIYLCECPITNLQFYFPFKLDGDQRFYEELSGKEWYYDQERWEHLEVISRIHSNEHLLEIGSGDGAFLTKLKNNKAVHCTGLEFNPNAIKRGREKGIDLAQQSISDHVKQQAGKYDVVCSFQVMEHISEIHSVLLDSIKALKPHGRLVIAVPNNDAYFLKDNIHPSRYLNMPPHHVNLFTENSLSALVKIYPLRLVEIVKEPMQETHVDIFIYKVLSKLVLGNNFLTKLIWKTRGPLFFRPLIRRYRRRITGHTIIAIFEKI